MEDPECGPGWARMIPSVLSSASKPENGRSSEASRCPQCGAPISDGLRNCPTCACDLGFPNVRAATSTAEVIALEQRFMEARGHAQSKGLVAKFDEMVVHLSTNSHVVVAMPTLRAREFLSDTRSLYQSYEQLVDSDARVPSPLEHDTERRAVAGKFFGSYAPQIKYGVLSLDGRSLPNYGPVHLRLRDVAIEMRVAFSHENTYILAKDLSVQLRGGIPHGYRSDWKARSQLAAAKLASALSADDTFADWATRLVYAGATRDDDRCIEAHIFGPFDRKAVHSVAFARGKNKGERMDIKVIVEMLRRHSQENQ